MSKTILFIDMYSYFRAVLAQLNKQIEGFREQLAKERKDRYVIFT